ncbi:mycothiol synthase [Leucobacter sp. CSA1]|uniref:Mycothiol acetyltransferase n=1 Tax=Leucobacter chromiisoli TaxID=2796471 RepID=A0A934QAX3_9MICO|nr:mycothiol synthase [Leucobacter chromiisoli]MBK0419952.1 mycothiol synthase [Leucobacter chromiisoli]
MTGIRITHASGAPSGTESGEPADAGALTGARALIAEAERVDGTPPVSDQAVIAAERGERALLAFAVDPEEDLPSPAAVGILGGGEVDLVVHPAARGRGVGTAALTELLRGSDGELRAWSHGENPAADALLASAGFSPVRELLRMALDPARLSSGRDPLALPTPHGMELRAFDPSREADAEAWVRVNAASFAAHPEQGRITLEDFALMRREPWFDPSDLILLADTSGTAAAGDDRLAGSTWIKTVRGDRVECELYAVGVRPEYAGRGLGRLLLDVTLARMAQHAPDRVTLYVDGDNEPAVHLYEAAGFAVESRSRQWRRGASGSA